MLNKLNEMHINWQLICFVDIYCWYAVACLSKYRKGKEKPFSKNGKDGRYIAHEQRLVLKSKTVETDTVVAKMV